MHKVDTLEKIEHPYESWQEREWKSVASIAQVAIQRARKGLATDVQAHQVIDTLTPYVNQR